MPADVIALSTSRTGNRIVVAQVWNQDLLSYR